MIALTGRSNRMDHYDRSETGAHSSRRRFAHGFIGGTIGTVVGLLIDQWATPVPWTLVAIGTGGGFFLGLFDKDLREIFNKLFDWWDWD